MKTVLLVALTVGMTLLLTVPKKKRATKAVSPKDEGYFAYMAYGVAKSKPRNPYSSTQQPTAWRDWQRGWFDAQWDKEQGGYALSAL